MIFFKDKEKFSTFKPVIAEVKVYMNRLNIARYIIHLRTTNIIFYYFIIVYYFGKNIKSTLK